MLRWRRERLYSCQNEAKRSSGTRHLDPGGRYRGARVPAAFRRCVTAAYCPGGATGILTDERPSGTRSLELAIETVAVAASFPAVGVIPAQEALAGIAKCNIDIEAPLSSSLTSTAAECVWNFTITLRDAKGISIKFNSQRAIAWTYSGSAEIAEPLHNPQRSRMPLQQPRLAIRNSSLPSIQRCTTT